MAEVQLTITVTVTIPDDAEQTVKGAAFDKTRRVMGLVDGADGVDGATADEVSAALAELSYDLGTAVRVLLTMPEADGFTFPINGLATVVKSAVPGATGVGYEFERITI